MPSTLIYRPDARVIPEPAKTICPLAGFSKPEIVFSVVVFPAPFVPMSATSCPRPTWSETPLSTVTFP
jgi:hypothetical protein